MILLSRSDKYPQSLKDNWTSHCFPSFKLYQSNQRRISSLLLTAWLTPEEGSAVGWVRLNTLSVTIRLAQSHNSLGSNISSISRRPADQRLTHSWGWLMTRWSSDQSWVCQVITICLYLVVWCVIVSVSNSPVFCFPTFSVAQWMWRLERRSQ